MRVEELTIHHLRVPLKQEIRHASHSRTRNETIAVRCRLDDGTVGWGEGLPRSYVTGETIETALAMFNEVDWQSQLDGRFDNLADLIGLCEGITLPTVPDKRDCFGNTLRCAVELALLDAGCGSLGVPVSAITEAYAPAEAIRSHQSRVRYSAVLTHIRTRRKQFFWSVVARGFGFRSFKVKVGSPDLNDRDAVKWSRRGIGRRSDMRIDANEAWTSENLGERLEPLLRYRIESVEQPVPHEDVDGLGQWRGTFNTLLMLDESLCSEGDADRAIGDGLCDLFNLRLSKCGGFLQSLRLAAAAKAAGLGYQVGCQVGETGILSAAGRHFACSVANVRYLEGSFDRWLLHDPLIEEDLLFDRGGWADEINRPGLGITVKPESIDRHSISSESRHFR